jgi:endonuclease-8
MPEGDTIARAARTLHRALAGGIVTRFESVYPALARVDSDDPIAGRTVDSVGSRGKHLLMTFSGPLVLHTHMRMNGSWHIYRPSEPWQRPARDMRVLVSTAAYVAVGFNVPVAEFLAPRDLVRHEQLAALGPDLADAAFDREEVLRRIRDRGTDPIEHVLLNQRVMSGIGNVLKSEILFVSGVDPVTPAGALSSDALQRLITVALRLMAMNVVQSEGMRSTIGRRTTGSLNPDAKLWVYGRGGKPCRKCGSLIQSKKIGLDARVTYWCAKCQV